MLRVSLRLTLEKSDCCPIDVWSYVWRCQSGVLSDSSGPVARSAILMLPTMVIHVRAKPKDICAPACNLQLQTASWFAAQGQRDPQRPPSHSGSSDSRHHPLSEMLVHELDRADLRPVTVCTAMVHCSGQPTCRIERHTCRGTQHRRTARGVDPKYRVMNYPILQHYEGGYWTERLHGVNWAHGSSALPIPRRKGRSASKPSYAQHVLLLAPGDIRQHTRCHASVRKGKL